MIEMTIDTSEINEFAAVLSGFSQAVAKESADTMQMSLDIFEAAVVGHTPVNTGALRGSIGTKVAIGASAVMGEVFTPLDPIYGQPVEFGRKPGKRPPTDAIKLWVVRKLGLSGKEADSAAFLIARAIGRRGTQPAKMFEQGFEQMAPTVIELWSGLGDRVMVRMLG
jgi:hypothetical protein